MGRAGVDGFDPERLRSIRERRRAEAGEVGKWTQAHVAQLVGVERTYYLLWESGDRTPGPAALVRLAEVLEVAPHELTSLDPAGASLRQLRELAGLTQADVAQQLGMSRSGWALYERGARTVDGGLAGRVADVLGLADPSRLSGQG